MDEKFPAESSGRKEKEEEEEGRRAARLPFQGRMERSQGPAEELRVKLIEEEGRMGAASEKIASKAARRRRMGSMTRDDLRSGRRGIGGDEECKVALCALFTIQYTKDVYS